MREVLSLTTLYSNIINNDVLIFVTPGPHFPRKEGALRVPEEQAVSYQAEDPGIR